MLELYDIYSSMYPTLINWHNTYNFIDILSIQVNEKLTLPKNSLNTYFGYIIQLSKKLPNM